MENLPNYDRWKTTPPDSVPEKHPNDLSHLYGQTVEFWYKVGSSRIYVCGIVGKTTDSGVWLSAFGGSKYYDYDDMKTE